MKKTLQLLSLLLALVFVLSFASCGNSPEGPTDETTTAEQTTTEEITTEEVAKTDPVALTIAGTPIENFVIVYENNEYNSFSTAARKLMHGEISKNLVTAEELAAVLKETTGKTLEIKYDKDYQKADGVKEILIGDTNRKAVTKPTANDEYLIQVTEGGDLAICGGLPGTTNHAAEAFGKYMRGQVAKGEAATLAAGANQNGTYHIKVVACIGDSITAGSRASDGALNYVSSLNRILWKDYYFLNYGNSGKTMRSDLADAYQKTTEYYNVTSGKIKYDLVTIMLGTNDGARDKTPWSPDEIANFKSSVESLIQILFEYNNKTKFIIMNCPQAYEGSKRGGSGDDYVVALQLETAKELKAKGIYKLYFFDMQKYTDDFLGDANYADHLHPNDQGYWLMAEGFAQAIEAADASKSSSYIVKLK